MFSNIIFLILPEKFSASLHHAAVISAITQDAANENEPRHGSAYDAVTSHRKINLTSDSVAFTSFSLTGVLSVSFLKLKVDDCKIEELKESVSGHCRSASIIGVKNVLFESICCSTLSGH